jgi:ADP-ribosylglycohydrolase
MLGAIAGDIIGSVYETRNVKSTDFPLFRWESTFTDDTVLTVAVADAILRGAEYGPLLKEYFRAFPGRGYGSRFIAWGRSGQSRPYGSWGNGSAMRVSPVGFAFDQLETVLAEAERSAAPTHDHPEGIKGAQATAVAVFLARTGESKPAIRDYVRQTFGYPLRQPLAEIRPTYRFDPSCQGTVTVAIQAFLESEDFEDAIRLAISVGGDSDTIACITGGVAHAFYGGVPPAITDQVWERLDERLANVAREFAARFDCG